MIKKELVGDRKPNGRGLRPFYASFWLSERVDGTWSVFKTKKEAQDAWRGEGLKMSAMNLTHVQLTDRSDLANWINNRRDKDAVFFEKRLIEEKRLMLHELVNITGRDEND